MEKVRPQALLLSSEQDAWDEERDELGLIPLDYEAMQQASERAGKLGDELQYGWDINSEQRRYINDTSSAFHSVAVNAFYDVNFIRLRKMAFKFLAVDSHYHCLITCIDVEDLLQQVYCDLLSGYLKLPRNSQRISKAIYKCFRYTAVGGLEGVENVKVCRAT